MSASISLSSDNLSPLLFAHCASGFGNERAFCRYRPPPVDCSLVGGPPTVGSSWSWTEKEEKRGNPVPRSYLANPSMLLLVFNNWCLFPPDLERQMHKAQGEKEHQTICHESVPMSYLGGRDNWSRSEGWVFILWMSHSMRLIISVFHCRNMNVVPFKPSISAWKWMFGSAQSANSCMADSLFTLSMNVCMQSPAGAASTQAFFPRPAATPSF